MNEMDIALWRHQVIAPLLIPSLKRGEREQWLQMLCEKEWEHPSRGIVKIGRGTMEDWVRAYQQSGFDGLIPRERKDKGASRRISVTMATLIERIATEYPNLNVPGLLKEVSAELGTAEPLPSPSTIYRFLKIHRLDKRGAPLRADHRAYSFEFANECWQSDIMVGTLIPGNDGRLHRTYLIAFLDDATRLIPHAAFYFTQDLKSFKDCLKQALLKRSVPERIYVDNAKIFRSRLLLLVAARLGFQLIHSRPYRPEGRAKLERFFRTVRESFLTRVSQNHILDIAELNRLLHAFIEGDYHTQEWQVYPNPIAERKEFLSEPRV